jgi:hypothetical protein
MARDATAAGAGAAFVPGAEDHDRSRFRLSETWRFCVEWIGLAGRGWQDWEEKGWRAAEADLILGSVATRCGGHRFGQRSGVRRVLVGEDLSDLPVLSSV